MRTIGVQKLSDEGRRVVGDVAQRHGVSVETVEALLAALVSGNATQAQFSIGELGGMGQWSRGGMTMVGDMFNSGLKARVDALCSELAGLVDDGGLFAKGEPQEQGSGGGGSAWPEDLGKPSSTGSQNDMRYAVFPETQRLAIDRGGKVTVYDTGDHRIGGASQQQSGDQSLSFTSQNGPVNVADLPVVGADAKEAKAAPGAPKAAAISDPVRREAVQAGGDDDVFGKIERLADLRAKGVLTEPEFEAKKAELLARL